MLFFYLHVSSREQTQIIWHLQQVWCHSWLILFSCFCFIFFFFCVFWDQVLLFSTRWPGTCSVDQAGLKLRPTGVTLPDSASQVLGLKVYALHAVHLKIHLLYTGSFFCITDVGWGPACLSQSPSWLSPKITTQKFYLLNHCLAH